MEISEIILTILKITDSMIEEKNIIDKNIDIKIGEILQGSRLLSIPKGIREILKNKAKLQTKMNIIRNNRRKFKEYIDILFENKEENINIIKKYSDIVKYYEEYYDKYSSIYLRNLFQVFVVLLNRIKVETFQIAKFSDYINEKIDVIIDNLKFSPEIKYTELDNTINEIKINVNKIKIYLMALQSSELLEKTSPIIDSFELNKISKSDDTKVLINDTSKLDDQYDKFISEIEVMKI
jgi:hypothetical protein